MSKSIFISCVYEDSHRIDKFEEWVNDGKLGDVVLTYETEDKRQEGKGAIRSHIKNKIRGAAIIIVLIGNDTHNHKWIYDEVELAKSFHKKIICVRILNTTSSIPKFLSKLDITNFDPESIRKHIQ